MQKIKLEQKLSEKTLQGTEIQFSGKVISVTEYQSTSPLKRIFTPKRTECGLKTRKIIVTLEIHSNFIIELLDGQVIAKMDLSSLQFGMVPSKQGKRFQFTLQGRSDGKFIKREYEVQSASELAIWYSQINREDIDMISMASDRPVSMIEADPVMASNSIIEPEPAQEPFVRSDSGSISLKDIPDLTQEQTGQSELFWTEFRELVQKVKNSVSENLNEIRESDEVLELLMMECNRLEQKALG